MGAGGASKKKGENREKSKMMPFELRVTDFPFDDIELSEIEQNQASDHIDGQFNSATLTNQGSSQSGTARV